MRGDIPETIVDDSHFDLSETGWWYHTKKRFALFPGITSATSGEWLQPYYQHRAGKLGVLGVICNLITFILFHIWLPLRTILVARKWKLGPEWIKRACRLGSACFIDPNDIALFRISTREQAGLYLRRFENAPVSRLINPACWNPQCKLANKLAFHNQCVELALPHPAVLASARGGSCKIYQTPEDGELLIKPTAGEGGSGIELVRFASSSKGDQREQDFVRFCQQVIGDKGEGYLVQRRLRSHPDLEVLGGTALLTVRLVTMRNESGAIEPLHAVLRFPAQGDAFVDNVKSGGMMANVDLATARLGCASAGKTNEELERHPRSGVTIEGMEIPNLADGIKDAVRAHGEGFSQYTIIGWDIAVAQDGAYLLEGNGKPGLVLSQRGTGTGAGSTRHGALIRFHIEREIGGEQHLNQ